MDIKQKIINLLSEFPGCMDNDRELISRFWQHEMSAQGFRPEQFFNKFAEGYFTKADSITRIRRLVQQENPDLRGFTYKNRKSYAELYPEKLTS